MGRKLMNIIGVDSPPDVYTAAIGLYLLWITGRAISVLISYTKQGGLNTVVNQLVLWITQVGIFVKFLFFAGPLQ